MNVTGLFFLHTQNKKYQLVVCIAEGKFAQSVSEIVNITKTSTFQIRCHNTSRRRWLYSYAFSSLPNNITNKTPKDHKVYIQQILLPAYNYYEQCNILFLSSQAFEVLSHWYTSFTSNGLFANKLIKLKSKTLRFETYCTEWKKKACLIRSSSSINREHKPKFKLSPWIWLFPRVAQLVIMSWYYHTSSQTVLIRLHSGWHNWCKPWVSFFCLSTAYQGSQIDTPVFFFSHFIQFAHFLLPTQVQRLSHFFFACCYHNFISIP